MVANFQKGTNTDLGSLDNGYFLRREYVQLDWTPSTHTHEKIIPEKTKGLWQTETTNVKLSAKSIQIFWVHFCVIHFDLFYKNRFLNYVQTKMNPKESDSPYQILLLGCLRSF